MATTTAATTAAAATAAAATIAAAAAASADKNLNTAKQSDKVFGYWVMIS